jgi:hypothetical protein
MKPIPSLEDDIAQSFEHAMILNSFLQSLKPGPATLWLEGVADEVLAMPSARAGPASPGAKSLVSAIRGPSLSQGDGA